jgi:dTDP-glucose 4,6-dehydratase/UDP-glucuronate decarboxylase
MLLNQIFKDCKYITSKVSLSKFKNKKVLILGANSFLASYIIASLVYGNIKKKNKTLIFGASKSNPRDITKALILNFKNQIYFKKIDLTDMNKVKIEILNTKKYDYIFHCATYGQPEKWDENLDQTVILNTALVELLLKYSIKNKSKLMYFSSCDVYGENKSSKLIKENFFQSLPDDNYRSIYSLSKILGERICEIYKKKYNFKTYIVRPAHTFGPGQTINDRRLISQLIKRSLIEKKTYIFGSGKSIKTWGYIAEITSMFLNIMQYGKNHTYNTTSHHYYSISQIGKLIAKIAKVKFYKKKIGKNFVSKDYKKIKVSSKKYQREFKTKILKIPIQYGLRSLLEWNKLILKTK